MLPWARSHSVVRTSERVGKLDPRIVASEVRESAAGCADEALEVMLEGTEAATALQAPRRDADDASESEEVKESVPVVDQLLGLAPACLKAVPVADEVLEAGRAVAAERRRLQARGAVDGVVDVPEEEVMEAPHPQRRRRRSRRV